MIVSNRNVYLLGNTFSLFIFPRAGYYEYAISYSNGKNTCQYQYSVNQMILKAMSICDVAFILKIKSDQLASKHIN